MANNSHRQLLKLLVAVVSVALLAAVTYTCLWRTDNPNKRDKAQQLRVSGNVVIRGLSIDEFSGGRRLYTLRIDAVEISKRKVGVFRLGFWKVARLENLCIDFYEPTEGAPLEMNNQNGTRVSGVPKTDASLTDRDPPDFTKCLLGREKLKLLNLKGVSGIEMSPVRITVYRNTKVVSSITAGKGKIHFVNSTLILEDKVKIESLEGKWLECEKICWDTVAKRFRTTGHYTARLENSTFEGQGLETDFWLKNLSSRR